MVGSRPLWRARLFYSLRMKFSMKEGKKMNRKILSLVLALVMCVVAAFSLGACGENESVTADQTEAVTQASEPLWEDATYLEDTVLGEGATSIDVKVEAGEKSVVITINTDANNLEDALLSAELVEGEQGAYGLYIKKVNGILADYDADQAYWAMYKDGEYLTSGAGDTAITSGDSFELVYTK